MEDNYLDMFMKVMDEYKTTGDREKLEKNLAKVNATKILMNSKYGLNTTIINDPINIIDRDYSCLHLSCINCKGTGLKKDGSICIHHLACSCRKCSPYC